MKYFYLKVAYLLGKESKCVSRQVGVVIVKNGRIVSTGINGTPPGYVNCNDHFKNYDPKTQREEHHVWSKVHEIHAEQNAIAFSAKNGVNINGAEIYTILQPCDDCLKLLIAAGIKKIYYVIPYDKASLDNDLWNVIDYEQVNDAYILEWIKNENTKL